MIDVRPNHVDGYLLRAINDYKSNRFLQAIRDNTKALTLTRIPEQRASIYYNRPLHMTRSRTGNRRSTTLPRRRRSTPLEPRVRFQSAAHTADCRRGRAKCLMQLKRYQDAAGPIPEHRSSSRPDRRLWNACTCELNMGHEARAMADLEQSVRMDPGYLYGFAKLAEIAHTHHRDADAVQIFKRATRVTPTSGRPGLPGWLRILRRRRRRATRR